MIVIIKIMISLRKSITNIYGKENIHFLKSCIIYGIMLQKHLQHEMLYLELSKVIIYDGSQNIEI